MIRYYFIDFLFFLFFFPCGSQELGFSYVEMNASDTRGKKALETVIKESLSNVTVSGMLQGIMILERRYFL